VICVTLAKNHRARNRPGEGARLREKIIAAAALLIEEKGQDAGSDDSAIRTAGRQQAARRIRRLSLGR
jgi:hypothetical protein